MMKAVVFVSVGQPMVLEDRDKPEGHDSQQSSDLNCQLFKPLYHVGHFEYCRLQSSWS
jgi:hypothetical protein